MQARSGVFTALIVSDSCEAWQRGGVDVRVELGECPRACVCAWERVYVAVCCAHVVWESRGSCVEIITDKL